MHYSRIALLLVMIIPVSGHLWGQGQALDMDYYQVLQKAERLQNSGNFQAAYQDWEALNPQGLSFDQKAQRAFNLAYLGLVIGYKEAPGAMRRFVRDYPSAPQVNRAYTMVGQYYFSKAQYANALAWYKEAEDISVLTLQHQYEIAYAHFKLGQKAEAARFFSALTNATEYSARAQYYLAFIDYQNKKWEQALIHLALIDDSDRDDLEAWGLMADLAFRTGDYPQAAAWGIRALDLLQISGVKRNTHHGSLNGIVGRAYAQMGAYSLAISYLEKTAHVSARQMTGMEAIENQFYLGQTYAALGQNHKTIEVLSKIKDGEHLTQDVAYVLAGAYLAMDQKTEALNAYKKACEPSLERPFSAQAHYQYAKLTYDLRLSYTSVPEVLEGFFKRYPEHPKRAEVEQWWLNTLLEGKHYDQVITYLSDASLLPIKEFGDQRQIVLQRAHYLKGRQYYQQGLSMQAQNSFEQAQKINSSNLVGVQATFWSSMIYSESGGYQKALEGFDRIKTSKVLQKANEWAVLPFELGFVHMALKNYALAQDNFLRYLEQKESITKEAEARLNLADCYFASKAYGQALAQYDKVKTLDDVNQDYADFQGAMCLEFTQNMAAKVTRLMDFLKRYPASGYRDDVHFSLGNALVNLDRITEAKNQFTTLISNHKNSPLVASAYLNLGLISDNDGDYEKALDYFRTVVDLYPGSQEAISAVQSARNTFISLGRVQEYGNWVNALDFISIEEAALDQASFESAKQAYIEGKDGLSIQRFETYLDHYPWGRYALESHYFLSEIYWRQQNVAQALLHSDPVINTDQNPSYIIATLIRVARHYLATQEFQLAESALIRLVAQPLEADQRTFALTNLMQLMNDGGRWEEAGDYAQRLIDHLTVKGDKDLLLQAQQLLAWSNFELGAFELAREQYRGMEDIGTGEHGAQRALAQAYFAHLDQDFKGSNDLIQNLAQNYASYARYGARGLLLMARNFEALSDEFQARFILENIRDNMSNFPELQQEAIDRLAEMDSLKSEKEQND